MSHLTPRMHNRPEDPAYHMLKDEFVTKPKVHREGCYICEDMEFARMGLPLCNLCCDCTMVKGIPSGHIPADDDRCEDCEHVFCVRCGDVPPQEEICTCNTPCCELTGADVGVPEYRGIAYSCGSSHCPSHGELR